MTSLSFYDLLRKIPLFRVLSNTDLLHFAEKLIVEVVPKDKVIIREGKAGSALYIIQSGSVKVVTYLEASSEEILLSHLGKGDYFGEMALLSDEPRAATVIALENTELLKLSKREFEELLVKEPRLYKTLGLILSERLKLSNVKRAEAEAGLRRKTFSSGDLSDMKPLELIRFAEDHLFTGKIIIQQNKETGILEFEHGQLSSAAINNQKDKQHLKTILAWSEGKFEVVPRTKKSIDTQLDEEQENLLKNNPILGAMNAITLYAMGILGVAVVRNLFEAAQEKLIGDYPEIKCLDILANCSIAVVEGEIFKLNQKSISASAFLIRQFLKDCQQFALGFDQLDIRKLTANEEKKLDIIGFYKEYLVASETLND